MSNDTSLDLVTGAFSYSGSSIAEQLLDSGRSVRTLTFHPERAHPLQARVETVRYRFDDLTALTRSLEGVRTLYNTYWVRFDHGPTSFDEAIKNSRILFTAAKTAGVERIVHVSISNASLESPLPYFRGKAEVEDAWPIPAFSTQSSGPPGSSGATGTY
jgi:NADH dehydrogenase